MPKTDLQTSLLYSNRRRFLQTSTAALSGLALSSCGWTLGKVNNAPINTDSDNKLLSIYTWAGYTDEALLKRFTAETGIKVVADVFGSNEEMLAKIQAAGGGEYSIIYPSDYKVSEMVEKGLVKKLEKSRIIGLDRLFPRFQSPVHDPNLDYSVPIAWGTTGLIYNSEKLKKAPQDWISLWEQQQEISKRVTLLDDVREVIGATLKGLGYSYNSTDPKQLRQAYEKLTQLKPAIASFTSDAWQSQILTEDLLVAMCYSSDANKVIQENSKLQYIVPSSGSSLWMDTMIIPTTARNPDAAYAWINFMLQPDVAAEICQRLSFATPNQAGFNQLPPEIHDNQRIFPPEALLEKCESIASVGNFVSVYDNYWTRLRSS